MIHHHNIVRGLTDAIQAVIQAFTMIPSSLIENANVLGLYRSCGFRERSTYG